MVSEVPSLMESSRAVLRILAAQGPVTRPKLGLLLDLSKPTMSAAVAELTAVGLVSSRGSEKGALGRTATLYGLGPAAGYVIGIDVGTAQVRAVAYTLDGQALASVEEPIPAHQSATADEVGEVIWSAASRSIGTAERKRAPLRSIAVAVPRIVTARSVASGRSDAPQAPLARLRREVDVPILIENNVNCAGIGEKHYGVAKDCSTFAYLQVGVRIGLGLIIENRLFRGSQGAAGEVGRLPFPWSGTAAPSREGLERYLGSEALIERCGEDWPAAEGLPPHTAKELFARAEAGSAHARLWVDRHARDIGRLVAACIGLIDPGLVVLGGGVGQNPLLVAEVERVATELTWPTGISVSSLGAQGTVLGAMKLAADYSLGWLLNEARHPAVLMPPRLLAGPAV